ncbi:hypothetical protein [Peribacillus butanolivorans]|uniref:hypothetical protein n=1 Tax=Peribacillus butanolivorans TaxID=421767 RepID=UPI0036BE59C0
MLDLSSAPAFTKSVNAAEPSSTEEEVPNVNGDAVINTIEPYVYIKEDGTIALKEVPQEIYETFELEKLEAHFDELNTAVHNKKIVINEDLTITELTMTRAAVYGKWTNHWWGMDRKFNNADTKTLINRVTAVAGGAGIAGGIGYWFPPIGALLTVTSGYWTLVGSRLGSNNKGKGVYVGVTWAAIFNINPL